MLTINRQKGSSLFQVRLTSPAVSQLHNGTALPMVGVMLLCALVGLAVLVTGRRSTRYRAREEDLEEEASCTII